MQKLYPLEHLVGHHQKSLHLEYPLALPEQVVEVGRKQLGKGVVVSAL
jgi:hypothetical protein